MAQDQIYLTFAKAASSGPYDESPTLSDSVDSIHCAGAALVIDGIMSAPSDDRCDAREW
jgi:hypothetical protein